MIYQDDRIDSTREQLLGLDGVLVWVNPIQDGANRTHLDALLREVSSQGVWVSAHPDVILKLGTKKVLFQTRALGWGTDTDLYKDWADFKTRFPERLERGTIRVLKQARGNGGNGVWKVTLLDPNTRSILAPNLDAIVEVQHALEREHSVPEKIQLGVFIDRCEDYFAWSGCLIDQPFQERLADGLVRCYFLGDKVAGFCHQWPKGLLDPSSEAARRPPLKSTMEGPETPAYRLLKDKVEKEWIPQMKRVLAIDTPALPAIWDADFLYGPKNEAGEDSYVLCEINVSAVWPFPEQAIDGLARAAVMRALGNRSLG